MSKKEKRRILLLSRPVINAGDFLFSEKSEEAFRRICSNVEVIRGNTRDKFNLSFLNSFDAIVAAGGPLFDNRFLNKNDFPLLDLIDQIKPRIFFLSAGWYGRCSIDSYVKNYYFDKEAIFYLKKIEQNNGCLSCRDDITKEVLVNNGLKNVKMVGCAAWYDYDMLQCVIPKYNGKINRVIVSDQGITKDSSTWEWKYKSFERAMEVITEKFGKSDIIFTFNGGIKTKYSEEYNEKICKYLEKYDIRFWDISGSADGFKIYDEADLHIGFRVHSHIYCMSKRIPSILISEDARGSGCNNSMGLIDICDYSLEDGKLKDNNKLGVELSGYIEKSIEQEFQNLTESYIVMKKTYYNSFKPFVRQISC